MKRSGIPLYLPPDRDDIYHELQRIIDLRLTDLVAALKARMDALDQAGQLLLLGFGGLLYDDMQDRLTVAGTWYLRPQAAASSSSRATQSCTLTLRRRTPATGEQVTLAEVRFIAGSATGEVVFVAEPRLSHGDQLVLDSGGQASASGLSDVQLALLAGWSS